MDRKPNVVGVPVEEERRRDNQPSQPARESGEETPPRELGHEDAAQTEGIGYTESGKEWDRLDRIDE
jgi:hypothetical protein